MAGKMDLWNKVCETPKEHTKHVAQRGGFTAINAHYQVMRATEIFGAVGSGWGYTVRHDMMTVDKVIYAIADVTVWHGNRDNVFGPWRGMSELLNLKGKHDADATKKATTDALTKALSHIGIGADVFLGLYDDNKYMAELEQKASQKAAAKAPKITDQQIKAIQAFYSKRGDSREKRLESLSGFVKREVVSLKDLTKAEASTMIDIIKKHEENNGK